MQDTLIVNIDYCGTCAGSCPVCALRPEERAGTGAFLSIGQVERAFDEALARGRTGARHLVVGMGRGNTLALGDEVPDHVLAIARAAEARFSFEEGEIEVSTSVMGRLAEQTRRAGNVLDAFAASGLRLDPRFVVVANTSLDSDSYWRHITAFLDRLAELRGGGDGSGDILLLNLSLAALPDIAHLTGRLGRYRFPINVTWAPTLDPAARDPEALKRLEAWMADWHDAMLRLGMDGSLVARAADGHAARDADPAALRAQLGANGSALLFVDAQGALHEGFSCVSADMDPVRFASGAGYAAGSGLSMVRDPAREIAQLLRWPACRGCPHMPGCIVSGAHKAALLAIPALDPTSAVCPSGMRTLLGRLDHDAAS